MVYKSDYPQFMVPAGYMNITMSDWAKLILLHLDENGKGIIQPDTLKKLHTPADSVKWDINIGFDLNYALGWFTKTAENSQAIQKSRVEGEKINDCLLCTAGFQYHVIRDVLTSSIAFSMFMPFLYFSRNSFAKFNLFNELYLILLDGI